MEDIHPVRRRPQAQFRIEDVAKRIAVCGAQTRRGKTVIGPQLFQRECRTQTTKRLIRPGRDVDMPVLRFERPGWTKVMEVIAHRWHQSATLQEGRGASCEHADEPVQQVSLYVLSPTGLLTIRQS